MNGFVCFQITRVGAASKSHEALSPPASSPGTCSVALQPRMTSEGADLVLEAPLTISC